MKRVGKLLPTLPAGIEPTPEPDVEGIFERRRQHIADVEHRTAEHWRAVREGTYQGHVAPLEETPDGLPPCDVCRGARWLRRPIDNIHDPDFGSMVPCPECIGIVTQRRLTRLWGELPSEFREWTFETFPAQPTHVRLLEILHEWIDAEGEPWLYLFSKGTGRGKTGLAVALLKEIIERGHSGMFVIEPDMLSQIKASFASHDAWREAGAPLLAALRDVDILVYDDVGTGHYTDWATHQMFELIAYRHANGRRTIFTSNVALIDLIDIADSDPKARLIERTAVRIKERCGRGHWVLDLGTKPDLRDAPPVAF